MTGITTIADLATRLRTALGNVAEPNRPYALLDFPAHPNIGDNAIWLGEIALLGAHHGGRPSYVSHLRYPFAEIARSNPEDVVLYLHGGGNFGDVWPLHQRYREHILAMHPRHRIVQMPQSIHYRNRVGLEATKRAIGGHRDFHLMVRDRESADLAKAEFDCPVILSPDSAFGIDLSAFKRASHPQGGVALMRSDQERRIDAAQQALFDGPSWRRSDWSTMEAKQRWHKAEMGLLRFVSAPPLRSVRESRFTHLARKRVEIGFSQLDQGKVVVTDRLHGHILGGLLGKPQVVIDNFYGKIRRFIDAWGSVSRTLIAADYTEAKRMADDLLAET